MWFLHLLALLPKGTSISPLQLRAPPLREIAVPDFASHVAVYCLSDLHADSNKNQLYIREHCLRNPSDANAFTVLIVPGDIGAEVDRIERVFRMLTSNYNLVCYVPGNHEVIPASAVSTG